MEIYHQYVKLRKHFGKWPKMVDDGAEMIADVRPNEEHAAAYIERSPVTTCAQVIPEMSEHEANTNEVLYSKHNINHIEGGWPKDVDHTEAEHTIRFRKKVEKDEDYIAQVVKLGGRVEARAKQNNAIDIFQQYYTDTQDIVAEVPHASTLTVLKDPTAVTRSVNTVDWNTDGTKIATAYAIMDFQQQPENMSLDSYVWDVHNPNDPEYVMKPLSQGVVCKFNLKDPNIVGMGQYNGQFSVFDMRKGSFPVDTTPMDLSHTEPIYDFVWLQSKTGTELMTVSTDGQVMWWDIRMFGEYVDKLKVDKTQEIVEVLPVKEKGSDMLLGGVTFGYDAAAGATKFMIGCETGAILSCNRKAKNPVDRVAGVFAGHHGPVYGLKRHPFAPKYFLSIGDWTARIWAEDSKQPLITTKYHNTYLTGGMWSPTRPGVFFTTRQDGVLDVWDLYFKHQEATLQVKVTDSPLASIACAGDGKHLAVGAMNGSCTILQLCQSMYVSPKEEKAAINAMLEREGLREKNLEKTIKEARLKAKKEANKKDDGIENACDEDLAKLETEFFSRTDIQSQAHS